MKLDLTGQRYGKLYVIKETDPYVTPGTGQTLVRWLCKCDCGNETKVITASLRTGNTKSCGCGCIENRKKILHRKGEIRCKYPDEKRLRNIMVGMRQRCFNPHNAWYVNYGGRGITVCEEWMRTDGMDRFCEWALNHGYKPNLTIDRIDNNKGYSPDNCRWVDRFEQMSNTRSTTKIEYNGEIKGVAQWAREYNIRYETLVGRLKRGWDIEKALLTPINTTCWHKTKNN